MNIRYAQASKIDVIDMTQNFFYRYSVFVEHSNWTLPAAGVELDVGQLDRDSTAA